MIYTHEELSWRLPGESYGRAKEIPIRSTPMIGKHKVRRKAVYYISKEWNPCYDGFRQIED